jgi:4-azaleucine resistance transporter AzlC
MTGLEPAGQHELEASRRRLLLDAAGISLSALGFGFVYGLAAREAGLTPIEASAMSVIVFGGAAQFAAVGYLAAGLTWPAIILLTGLVNARHILYSAALAPWLRSAPLVRRAVMAHLLTDEAFAISVAHFTRLRRADEWGYWLAAIGSTFIPWNAATLAGAALGGDLPQALQPGLEIIFPAAMIGLATGIITGRRELAAAVAGGGLGLAVALLTAPSVGIVVGGIVGPVVGLLVPQRLAAERAPLGTSASAERFAMPGARFERPRPDEASDRDDCQ